MTIMASIHLMHVRHRAIYILHAAVGTQHTREVSLNIVVIINVIVEPNQTEPNRCRTWLIPSIPCRADMALMALWGVLEKEKNIRSKIMGSPGVGKDVCVSNNRLMIMVRKSAKGNFFQ